MEKFTVRNVAKYVVTTAVHCAVEAQTATLIVDHTEYEEDTFVPHIVGHIAGWLVSDKLKPRTDRMVDKTADWITARKNKTEKITAE